MAIVTLGTLAGARVAAAEPVAGTYEVKFELAANNCTAEYLKFQRSDLKLEIKGANMTVSIDRVPLMNGAVHAASAGKISVKSRVGHTAVAGLDGVFTAAGRVQNGLMSLVMVGEYQSNGKPLCTMSWNVSGTRKDDAPAQTPPKK